jgi:hypothetical protein
VPHSITVFVPEHSLLETVIMPGVFLKRDNELIEMTESGYAAESLLQQLLEEYPNLLVGDQIDPEQPRQWLLVEREAGLPITDGGGDQWSVDHLFLDQDGIPTLVEVKRSTNREIRRSVIGQMLDYAANAATFWPMETIRGKFESRVQGSTETPQDVLARTFELQQEYGEYWDRVKTNLVAGKIRLIIVSDTIPPELRRVVEFLNRQMDPAEFLAMEIRQYVSDSMQTLVPRVFGQGKAPQKVSAASWDEARFFEAFKKNLQGAKEATARRILEWAKATADIWWGSGAITGSFVPVIKNGNQKHALFAVWTTGHVEIYFYWYSRKEPFGPEEKRLELLHKLNAIEGITLSPDSITKRPNIVLRQLNSLEQLEAFLHVFDWVVAEIKAYS